ncbi:MAG: hypothetical protein HY401_10410 [Elusimicrobia bacterium]|nr:hypothetical protein [Elusimicrobiota bacterium]
MGSALHIEATATFKRLYSKLPMEIQKKVKKALTLLQTDPHHPSLGHKKMTGQVDIYELRVTLNYRITYQKIGSAAYLRKVGTHDLLRNP